MLIDETTFPIEFDWEGELVPPTGVFAPRGSELPSVSLGKPDWWNEHQIFRDNWTQPSGDKRYGLARFAFSLRPRDSQEVRRAEFTVYLEAQNGGSNPTIFDLFPQNVTQEQTSDIKAEINPQLKFAEVVEASIGSVEVTLHRREARAIITADGIGESTARWIFNQHPATPLTGSQIVYAIVELPKSVTATRVTVQLSAEVTTRFGLIRGLLPTTNQDQRRWILTLT
jgi:hypothetical protein